MPTGSCGAVTLPIDSLMGTRKLWENYFIKIVENFKKKKKYYTKKKSILL